MSDERNEVYEFAGFRLDVREHTLERVQSGENITLPEKAFQTLCALVQNRGHLMRKQELLDLVWPDSFVEENNLDKSIHAIRNALGERSSGQKYIQTVRKHGYRFVAEVSVIIDDVPDNIFEHDGGGTSDNSLAIDKVRSVSAFTSNARITESGQHALVSLTEWRDLAGHTEGRSPALRLVSNDHVEQRVEQAAGLPVSREKQEPSESRSKGVYLAVAASLVIAIGLGVWLVSGRWQGAEAPILQASFSSERLSTDGRVLLASIAPNGKFVVYSHGHVGEGQSLWLRNLESGHATEVIAESDGVYFGLDFSPEGDWLYYARQQTTKNNPTDIYRITIPGGIPERIASDTKGWMSISPDGTQLAFLRCHRKADDFCSLFVADSSTGANERKLVTRPRPHWIRGIDFSPDGKLIAFASGQSQNAGADFALSAIDVASGEVRELSPERFFNIRGVAWLPDQRSALIAASRGQGETSRIWRISMDTGKAEPLTKDSDNYIWLSLDRNASSLVATSVEEAFRIRVLDRETGAEKFVIPQAWGMRFDTEGKLFYASTVSGNNEIWSVGTDGRGKKQLTNDSAHDGDAVISPDNSTLFFGSSRSGSIHVWRMDPAGTDPVQITHRTGGFPLAVSPEGDWVFYQHGLNRSLWRVSTRNGEEQMVLKAEEQALAVSPDGTLAAYPKNIDGENFVLIVSLASGQPVDQLKVAEQDRRVFRITWFPDGKSIAYILSTGDGRRNTVWLHSLDESETPKNIADISEPISEGGHPLAFSPDGKSFAVSQGDWLHDAVLFKGLK